jgi:LysR family transcriptional regulator, benzoate and cis,cis-muconate-responsive activator of ben and cat genes
MLLEQPCLFGIMTLAMELRHLRYFQAVAEALSFTKAAARLRIAQPALSRQVQDLEDEIGVDLVKRSPRGLTLTAEGKLFLEEARELLKRADESVKKVRALARGEYGELHIGYSPTPTIEILPPALAAFQKAVPRVQVLLHDLSSDEIADGLRSGTIQLAVTPEESGGHMTDIEFESLRTYPICLALAPSHPLARLKSIPLQKVASEPLITLNRKNYPGAYSRLEQLFRPLGVRPRIALEVDSSSSLVAAIESRRGVGLAIPVLKLVTGKRLVYRPLAGVDETVSVGIARAKNGDPTPAGERFSEILRKLARNR